MLVVGAMGLLLVACDALDRVVDSAMEAVTSEEASTTEPAAVDQGGDATDPGADGGDTEAADTEEVPESSNDQEEAASAEAADADSADEGASDEDLARTLQAAVERANTAIDSEADFFDQRCDDLAEWEQVRAATSGLPDADGYGDAGHLRMMEELHFFGCGFGRYQTDEGFVYSGVVVSVQEVETELPSGFDPATTPGGLPVLLGVGAIGEMGSFGGDPASAAVLRAGEAELHVSSPTELLTAEDLLPVVDAAVADLAAAG